MRRWTDTRRIDLRFQLLACMEGDYPARTDRYFFAGFRVATGALRLVT
jgi:hypothetical protein